MPRKPRRANLIATRRPLQDGTHWVKLVFANGLIAMHSETYYSGSNARRAKADIEAAMADYLRSKGYVVRKPEEAAR